MVKKNKTAIDKNPIEAYRRMLLEKEERVLAGLGMKFDTLARMGRVAEEDQAQISHDEFVSLQLNGLDYIQLRLVKEALDRIESGHYGVCLACEEPIPEKRLMALPWARYCVACQEEIGAQQEADILEFNPRFSGLSPIGTH